MFAIAWWFCTIKNTFFPYLLLYYVLSCNIAMQKFKVFSAYILLSFLVAAENFSVFVMHEMDFRECSMHSKSKWFSALFESPYFTLHKIGTTRIFLHGTYTNMKKIWVMYLNASHCGLWNTTGFKSSRIHTSFDLLVRKMKICKKKLAEFEILFAQRLLTTFGIALTICKVLSNQMIYISKAYWSANHLVPK